MGQQWDGTTRTAWTKNLGQQKTNGTCSNGVVCAYAFAAVAAAAARPTLLLPLLLLLLHALNALLMLPRMPVVAHVVIHYTHVVIHYTHVQVDVLVRTYSPDYGPATSFLTTHDLLLTSSYLVITTYHRLLLQPATAAATTLSTIPRDPTSLPFLHRHVAQVLSWQSDP